MHKGQLPKILSPRISQDSPTNRDKFGPFARLPEVRPQFWQQAAVPINCMHVDREDTDSFPNDIPPVITKELFCGSTYKYVKLEYSEISPLVHLSRYCFL